MEKELILRLISIRETIESNKKYISSYSGAQDPEIQADIFLLCQLTNVLIVLELGIKKELKTIYGIDM